MKNQSGELERILIAENEPSAAAALTENVRALGFAVIGPVDDGEQAVETARGQQPQLALLDIRLPKMDGFEAAARLEPMHVPVVLLAASAAAADLGRAVRAGVFGYLLQPVTADALRIGVAVAWSCFQRQRRLRDEVDALKTALENRKLIERAKGLLMQRLGVSEPEAMKRLQKQARDSRRTMADLARALVEADQLLGGQD